MQERSAGTDRINRSPCVLSVLIRDFGGEATCLGMSHKLGRFIEAAGVRRSETRAWVQEQLSFLEGRGDVTVELTDSATLIARVTETGACRASG